MIPITIIDNDPERQALFERLLGRTFHITFAADPESGLASFKKRLPLIAILNVDYPDGAGISLCRRLRALPGGGNVKVLLVGLDLDDTILDRDSARGMGADDLTQLPLSEEKLRRKLHTFIRELKDEHENRKRTGTEMKAAPPANAPEAKPNPSTPATAPPNPRRESPPNPPPAKSAPPKEPAPELDGELEGLAIIAEEKVGPLSAEDLRLIGAERMKTTLRIAGRMNEMTYYELLDITPDTDRQAVRNAYFALAKKYHTDRFSMVKNRRFARFVGDVFKRMCEAYRVLYDGEIRKIYDKQLAGSGTVRLKKTERETEGKLEETKIANPPARKFFNLGMSALAEGNLPGAKMNLTLALNMAKDDPTILARLEEVKERMEEKKSD